MKCPKCGCEMLCRYCKHFIYGHYIKSAWGLCEIRHQVMATYIGPQSGNLSTTKNRSCDKWECRKCGHEEKVGGEKS